MATARMAGLNAAKKKMKEKAEEAELQMRRSSQRGGGSVLPASPEGRFTPSTPFDDGDDAAGDSQGEPHDAAPTGGCFEGAKPWSIPPWYANYAKKADDMVKGSKFSNFIIGIRK